MTESEVDRILIKLKSLQIGLLEMRANQIKIEGKVDSIYQGLYGILGTAEKGFCGRFNELEKDYYTFKRKVIMILCFAAGGGGITATLIKFVGG